MFELERFINSKKKGLALVLLLSSVFVFFFYGKVLLSPNSYLFNPSGDGMKNYYTYAYYIQNNEDNIEFEGMNYPYGESFMYTDCHPVEAYVLKVLSQYFPSIADYSIGIMNLAMILSIVLTSLVLYLLFNRLKINQTLAILAAIAITVLSPQLFRLTGGHYALSYSFFIPLIIYLLLSLEHNFKQKYLLLLSTIILLAFFTHAYIGMILFVLLFTYAIIGITLNFKNSTILYKYLKTLLAGFVPFVFFYCFVKLTDSHIGRTTNPWGIFENHADMASVFFPISGPLNSVKEMLFDNLEQKWEGWSYIGIIAIIGLILYLISLVYKKFFLHRVRENKFLKILFLSSILILCFATLLPFRKVMYEIVDSINLIKQFRAIGRFAWVFFFIINIIAVYVINEFITFLKGRNKGVFVILLTLIVPIVIFIEGIEYHTAVSSEITESKNLFDLNQTNNNFHEDCSNINSDEYEAIIGLPFFYIGSENFGKTATQEIYKLSFLFSYHLNLPMVNSYLTRTSIGESKKIMQLLSKGFYQKSIQADLKSDKPFLVICHHNNLSEDDKAFLSRAKMLFKREDYSLYEMSQEALLNNDAKEEYNEFVAKKETLFEKEGFLVSDTSLFFNYNDFNDTTLYQPFEGGIVDVRKQKGYNSIFAIKGEQLKEGSTYIARFWMCNNGKDFGQDYLNGMIFFNKKSEGKEEWIFPLTDARNGHSIHNNWSLVEVELTDIDKNFNYELFIKGPDRSKQYYYIDDLLFYNKDLDIYKLENQSLLHNNHKIDLVH